MHSTQKYNRFIEANLLRYIQSNDWSALLNYLEHMSNSEFRTSTAMIPDILLKVELDNFWNCFDLLYESSPKAWLGSLLKGFTNRMNSDENFILFSNQFSSICQRIHSNKRKIDENKIVHAILPLLKKPEDILQLFHLLCLTENSETMIRYLLENDNSASYFILFQEMRKLDDDPQKLSLYCAQILRKANDKAFNFVSIIKHYFDLPSIKASFSLRIAPYELSRIEQSYDLFKKTLTSI